MNEPRELFFLTSVHAFLSAAQMRTDIDDVTVSDARVVCPDGKSSCSTDYTCCEMLSGDYGCCPLPHVRTLNLMFARRVAGGGGWENLVSCA